MHIVFLRILLVLAVSFLAAISLANRWGMFVQFKLGPCDLISSFRPVRVIIIFFCFVFSGLRCSNELSRLSKSLSLSLHPFVLQSDSGNDFSNNSYSSWGETRDTASTEST